MREDRCRNNHDSLRHFIPPPSVRAVPPDVTDPCGTASGTRTSCGFCPVSSQLVAPEGIWRWPGWTFCWSSWEMLLSSLPLLSCGLRTVTRGAVTNHRQLLHKVALLGHQEWMQNSPGRLNFSTWYFLVELQRISEESSNLFYLYPSRLLFSALEGAANCVCSLYFVKRLKTSSIPLLAQSRWHWAGKELFAEECQLRRVFQTLIIWETQKQKVRCKVTQMTSRRYH